MSTSIAVLQLAFLVQRAHSRNVSVATCCRLKLAVFNPDMRGGDEEAGEGALL
jgi:hypothetical protein